MTPKSITLHALTGLLPSYGRVAVKVKAKPPDSLHLGDLSTKHVATNGQGMRILVVADVPYASGRSKERVPVSCGSRQSRKTRLFGRTLRDLFAPFSSRWPGPQKPTASAFTTRSRMSAILPAIKYPLQTPFHVSVLHRKPMTWTYAMAFNLPRFAPSGRSQP